jgi:hypothetical protein
MDGTARGTTKRRRLGRMLLRLAFGLLLLGLLKAAWFVRHRAQSGSQTARSAREDLLARRAYLLHRVLLPGFGPREFPAAIGTQFQGEWALVSLSMTALSVGGLVQQLPDAAGTSQDDLDRIGDRALSSELSSFDTERWQESALSTLDNQHGHVGYLGHLALILAVRETCFPGGSHRALLAQLARALARKLDQGPCGLAETYPGELYVPDNAVALAALALAARAGVSPDVAPGLLKKLRTRYAQPTSLLLPFRVDAGCQALDHDRASGAAWNLLYLALVDADYVRHSYPFLLQQFLDRPLPGLWGLREWPRGMDRGGDIDSGPLPFGLSPAATGFAIASARRMSDAQTLQRLLDTAELAGFSLELAGRRRYLLAPLVGDAILLAARAPLQVP